MLYAVINRIHRIVIVQFLNKHLLENSYFKLFVFTERHKNAEWDPIADI